MDHPRLSVLNDCHIGVIRTAGTTPTSAYQLRQYLIEDFGRLVYSVNNDLLINGDLFDKEIIPLSDVLSTFQILSGWLARGVGTLFLSAGNHDLSKNSSVLSSFNFLCRLLTALTPDRVKVIDDLQEIYPGYFVLPHVPNQDLLNDRLQKLDGKDAQMLFVHTNYDNNFAAQSDHSLNISRDQARACGVKFIVFGHEHQTRAAMDGKVVIPGNQTPSSVADCLGCTDNAKFFVECVDGVPVLTAAGDLSYAEMDWGNLQITDHKFIRVAGIAEASQGAQVAQVISRFRSKSSALVVTNAVSIRSEDGQTQQMAESLEAVQAFNVMAALKEILTDKEVAELKELGYE